MTVGAPVTAALNALDGRGLPTSDQLIGFGLLLVAAAVLVWLTSAVPVSRRSDVSAVPEA
jgi:hypothetical protein